MDGWNFMRVRKRVAILYVHEFKKKLESDFVFFFLFERRGGSSVDGGYAGTIKLVRRCLLTL